MKEWCKFFFLSFFRDGYARQAKKRSGYNVLLALAVVLLLLFGGTFTGFVASFSTHYGNADEFRAFVYSAFAGENGDGRILLSVKDGAMTADIPSGDVSLDGYRTGEYGLNGYTLIVDTRDDLFDLFDDCVIKYVCGDVELDRDGYLRLSESERSKYSFKVEYTGVTLDTVARRRQFESQLDTVCDENEPGYNAETAAAYDALKRQVSDGVLSEREYSDEVYKLYFKTVYPSIENVESYSVAPTILQYYSNKIASDSKYFVVTREMCRLNFVNSKGIEMQLDGKYGADMTIDVDTPRAVAEKNIDDLIAGVFEQKRGSDASVYIFNIILALPWLIIAVIVCAFIISFMTKSSAQRTGFFGAVKTVSCFMPMSALAAFLMAILLGFVTSRGPAYTFTIVTFAVALGVRSIVFAVLEWLRSKRETLETEASDGDVNAENTVIGNTVSENTVAENSVLQEGGEGLGEAPVEVENE